ncbi:NADPH-dependent glutamate synthase [Proteinivorax hydrogeniformans]|uniref:NADPH-dependent glutamate synthase n=1 Tax=Proteinivorax hydrogeniformans TaxID=1826727 RepID=A0AAU8HX93_9FIRM
MPNQDPDKRITNFDEVALGYDKEAATLEAKRCLQCKNPLCVQGCPVGIDIPEFIKEIASEDFEGALAKLKEKNSLPAICGRVCPQEDQCEKLCIVGKKNEPVGIGRLERFVADYHKNSVVKKASLGEKKVAVVGSGPAGLACASELLKRGYQVTIFEAFHKPGGVLMYGIPEFRLPKNIVEQEINQLVEMGAEIKTNVVIGQTITVIELLERGYEAVFIGSGAGLPYFLNIPGENLNGVYSANEFLTRANLMKAYLYPKWETPLRVGDNVAVVGAGNVAMDAARTAKRLGAKKVSIVYRRSEKEMPARQEEVLHAREEGIEMNLLTNPVSIEGNDGGWVNGLKCIKMELGEPDDSGRRRPKPIKGSEYMLEVDTVIMAIGQGPNPIIPRSTKELTISKRGNIEVDSKTGQTSIEGVFAGGDVVTGAATVIQAMGAGKKCAESIDKYIKNN